MNKRQPSTNKADKFKMPKWMECSWRRVACNKLSCGICGQILRDRKRHMDHGEDPEDAANVFEDIGNTLKKALQMIKKDADRLGIDLENLEAIKEPPSPTKFSLYRNVAKWRKSVMELGDAAEESESLWLETEAAHDLFWYANTLAAKTYRQLCNRWHIKEKDGYGEFDHEYTKYVLGECLAILKRALSTLSSFATAEKGELMLSAAVLARLEKRILNI